MQSARCLRQAPGQLGRVDLEHPSRPLDLEDLEPLSGPQDLEHPSGLKAPEHPPAL